MPRRTVLSIALCALAAPANADPFCDDINDLITASAALPTTEVTIALPQTDGSAGACAFAQGTENTRFIHCSWPFEFRAPEAKQAFEAVSQSLANCPTAQLREFKDQTVNHPDSYDLRIFDLDTAEVGLSLKDKGALQQTFVFLRVQGNPL
jgi:hypothetical protein